jgi:hypothetical protein
MSDKQLENVRAILYADGAWTEEWSLERHGPHTRTMHEQLRSIADALNLTPLQKPAS